MKKRLLERPDSPFFQRSQALYYKGPRDQEIRIDISPEWLVSNISSDTQRFCSQLTTLQGPYLPESATKVQDLSGDEIPYISLTDLIVFKLDSSGLRSNPVKKDRDACDAAALVDFAAHDGGIQLSEKQEQVVEEALCDVGKCGTKEKGWWERNMGLDNDSLTTPGEKRGRRPHSKSDPSPSREKLSNDPNTAWHYEQLDHAHIRRFNSLHSSRTRSFSHGRLRDTGFILTQPKTTHSSAVRRSGLSNEVPAGSSYDDDDDDQFYTLEPRGSTPLKQASADDYFAIAPRTPPGGLGTVAEHKPIGVRRASKAGYFDISPGPTPSSVTGSRRPPLQENRSVSFVL